MKKGFFDAPRPKPKPKSSEPEMVFLKGKKTTTASGAQIPDFMRVEVEGSEAAEKMKKELMNKLKPDKQTVDEVLNNAADVRFRRPRGDARRWTMSRRTRETCESTRTIQKCYSSTPGWRAWSGTG